MRDKEAKPLHIGRPRSEIAASHAAIMDAAHELLKVKPARDLTMDAIAKQANVGKPTLYKWWPSKAALIMDMFHERIVNHSEPPVAATAEAALRTKMRRLIREVNGVFGKVVSDLIAEGQSDPAILQEFWERHGSLRRESSMADIERGKLAGEFSPNSNAELLVDAIFGPVYYRLLLRFAPITEKYGNELIDQVLLGVRKERRLANRKKS